MKTIIILTILLIFNITYSQQDSTIEGLDYYPLQTGNYSEYKAMWYNFITGEGDTSIIIKSIVGDTVMENGLRYKIIQSQKFQTSEIYFSYERIDSLTGLVYKYENNSILSNHEYKFDNLFAQIGEISFTSRYWQPSLYEDFRTKCISIDTSNILGLETTTKYYYDLTGSSDGINYNYTLANGIGLYKTRYSSMGGLSSTDLEYAIINGIEYGIPITSIIEDDKNIPYTFSLYQNYPNPFNPNTTIIYFIPKESFVNINVYNSIGQLVKSLVNENQKPGKYKINFSAAELASGVYYYQLFSDNISITKKFLLLK